MAIKKSELYSSLWKSCDELRGSMDASQYKDYVLVLLFVKYVSDKHDGKRDSLIDVPKGGSFSDMVDAVGQPDIGDKMNKIIAKLAEANDLMGVINIADFNDPDKLGRGKEMVDRLSNLIVIFDSPSLDFSQNRAEGDDLLGDAYEFLMRKFATESGKSKGQFYTPAEVSRVIAKVISINEATRADQTIYDPTCGSGSLLLKAVAEAQVSVTIYGQENDNATHALCKMNMFLHDNPTADIRQGNTLANPRFKEPNETEVLKLFDYAVANPPFSAKSWSNGIEPSSDIYKRFEYGVPPSKNGDYAFLQHIIKSLKSTGKGAVILPHGVLFRGNVEATIRHRLVRQGYIKGIIGLPANLFYGTGIPACIIVLDKEHGSSRSGIFLIDASKGFIKEGNKNRLRDQDIHKIVDVFNNRIELEKYSRMVDMAEIEANDYNLNIPRYIDSTEPEDIQDIEAHLLGGIPKRDLDELEDYWQVFPTMRDNLFQPNERENYRDLKVPVSAIKPTIFEHPEFREYAKSVKTIFADWQTSVIPRLKAIEVGERPKEMIEVIADDLLNRFAEIPLISKYAVYQHLMSYWNDVMQDDVYMLVVDGWKASNKLRLLIKQDVKDKKSKQYVETHDFEIKKDRFKADLIPPDLVIQCYFAKEQDAITVLESKIEDLTQQMQQLDDEHGIEDGLLYEVKNDKGKYTKVNLRDRITEIKDTPDDADELDMLNQYLKLMDKEKAIKDVIKAQTDMLYIQVIETYPKLSEDEIKQLVIEDKWLRALQIDLQSELDRISRTLTARIKELAERYADPLPELEKRAEIHRQNVEAYLERMGYTWTQ